MNRIVQLCSILLLASTAAHAAETPEKWEKSYDRAIQDHVRKLASLADWCVKSNLEGSAWTIRQRALRWAPEDKKLLEHLGYRKTPEGEWQKDPNSRDKLRKVWDTTPNRNAAERVKKLARIRTATTRRLAGLAKRATQAAEDGDADAWRARARRAWSTVVGMDTTHEKAHRGLGSEQVDGRFVLRRWVPALRSRVALREAGKARARQAFDAEAMPPDPRLVRAGVEATGFRCGTAVAQSQYGPAIARSLAVWIRRAGVELVVVHGLPNPPTRGNDYVMHALRDKDEWTKAVVTGFGWTNEKAEGHLEKGYYGTTFGNAFVYYTQQDPGGTRSYDVAIQGFVRWVVRRESWSQRAGEGTGPGDWFAEALALDVVYRLTGQAIAMFSSDQGYRDAVRNSPEMNRWQAVARLAVERDDDIPLRVLWRLGINQLETRHTSKAYCFLQFLRERDPDEAKAFVPAVIRSDEPSAVQEVYGRSLESLDEEYAAWMRGTFDLPGF